MTYENKTGIGVFASYGKRDTGGSVGSERTSGSTRDYSLTLTGASVNSGFLPTVVVPKGSKFVKAILRVDEAFNITGTTPTVIIGGTAPATNGIVLAEAELEAIGTKTPASTGTGTWAVASATGTTAAEKIAKALGGTSPVVDATVGKATLILTFVNKTKI
jgi:hypothetical protein